MTTLPLDFPPLREGAEEMAREAWTALKLVTGSGVKWSDAPRIRAAWTDTYARLLADLTRPASRDFWARWLARHHGLTVGATAPVWQRIQGMDPSTIWSLSVRSDIDMDASPTVKVDQRGFVEPGAFPDSPIANVVPGISTVTDPAEALRLACLAAVAR